MVQVKILTNTVRKTIAVDENTKVREVLDNNNVNYASTPVYMDGNPISAGNLDKTFKELNVTEKCLLAAVLKTENA